MFIVVRVWWEAKFADGRLEGTNVFVKFCFKIGNIASEKIQLLATSFGVNARERMRAWGGLLS
jgi:hypothetical protein